MIRIGFFGTPSLAASVLQACIDHENIEVAFVVTNPDAPSGRGQKLQPSPVKEVAIRANIAVFTPEKIRGNTEFLDTLQSYDCDYFVTVAYGKILPVEILNMPKKLPINVHGSILPKYRGASPIQSALLHGESETGVTIMCMGEKMDEGDILAIKKIPISSTETSSTLFEKFAEVSPDFLIETLLLHDRGEITPVPQDHAESTYCTKFTKEQGALDMRVSSLDIFHAYQAYTPWPTLYSAFDNKRLILARIARLWDNLLSKDVLGQYATGEIFVAGWILFLRTLDSALILEELKLEWEKARIAQEFMVAHPTIVGTLLS